MSALRRMKKELGRLKCNPPPGCHITGPVNVNNYFLWQGSISGPKNTPYEGGEFRLYIKFPQDYPFKAPIVQFETIVCHPNIGRDGTVCMDILEDNWSPALTIYHVLQMTYKLMANPNPKDAIEPALAKLLIEDPVNFANLARDCTQEYAVD